MIPRKIKLLFVVVAGAALAATPAMAGKAAKKKAATHKPAPTQAQLAPQSRSIYAWDGRYLGWDPDSNIRFQIMRDQNMPHD
jgi:hypothetical protein